MNEEFDVHDEGVHVFRNLHCLREKFESMKLKPSNRLGFVDDPIDADICVVDKNYKFNRELI